MDGLDGALTWTVEGTPRLAPARCSSSHAAPSTASTTPAIPTLRRWRSSPPAVSGPDFFREVAAVLDAAAGGPPDLVVIAAVMGRHGLTPAP